MAPNSQNFNRNVERLLQYFLEKKLTGERYGLAGGLAEQEQGGRMALEAERHKNTIEEATDKYIQTISRDPEIDRISSLIFTKKQNGMDVTSERGDLESAISKYTDSYRAAFKAARGGMLNPDEERQFSILPQDMVKNVLGEHAQGVRQQEEITRIGEPGLQLQAIGAGQREKEIGIRRGELGLKGRELAQKDVENVGKLSDQDKATISLIGDTKKFLIGEGVKPTEAGQLMREIATGRALDPLSPQNRGMALQWLNGLELKIINKKTFTPGDQRFLETVMNTSGIEPPPPEEELLSAVPGRPSASGLVNPETGLRGGEEDKVNALVEQKVKDRMYNLVYQGFKNRGFSDETAAFHARNLLGQLK